MTPAQSVGGVLRDSGSDGKVCTDERLQRLDRQKFAGSVSPVSESDRPSIRSRRNSPPNTDASVPEFFSIPDLAARWRVSRSAVYGYLRGYPVIDFAPAPGRKGHKLVSADVVHQIEQEHMRVMR